MSRIKKLWLALAAAVVAGVVAAQPAAAALATYHGVIK